jgi:hypothetical protein
VSVRQGLRDGVALMGVSVQAPLFHAIEGKAAASPCPRTMTAENQAPLSSDEN